MAQRITDDIEWSARAEVTRRDKGLCTFDGCDAPGTDYHHVIPRSTCGRARLWDPHNGTLLCRPHHRWVTDNGREAHDRFGLHGYSWSVVLDGRVILS